MTGSSRTPWSVPSRLWARSSRAGRLPQGGDERAGIGREPAVGGEPGGHARPAGQGSQPVLARWGPLLLRQAGLASAGGGSVEPDHQPRLLLGEPPGLVERVVERPAGRADVGPSGVDRQEVSPAGRGALLRGLGDCLASEVDDDDVVLLDPVPEPLDHRPVEILEGRPEVGVRVGREPMLLPPEVVHPQDIPGAPARFPLEPVGDRPGVAARAVAGRDQPIVVPVDSDDDRPDLRLRARSIGRPARGRDRQGTDEDQKARRMTRFMAMGHLPTKGCSVVIAESVGWAPPTGLSVNRGGRCPPYEKLTPARGLSDGPGLRETPTISADSGCRDIRRPGGIRCSRRGPRRIDVRRGKSSSRPWGMEL